MRTFYTIVLYEQIMKKIYTPARSRNGIVLHKTFSKVAGKHILSQMFRVIKIKSIIENVYSDPTNANANMNYFIKI